jgi:hypothetical protein
MKGEHWLRYEIRDGPDQKSRMEAIENAAKQLAGSVVTCRHIGRQVIDVYVSDKLSEDHVRVAIIMFSDEVPKQMGWIAD